MPLVQMDANEKQVVDKNLISDECDTQVFKAWANLQPSTSKLTSQEEWGMYTDSVCFVKEDDIKVTPVENAVFPSAELSTSTWTLKLFILHDF